MISAFITKQLKKCFCVFILAIGFTTTNLSAEELDSIIAEVNGEIIVASELSNRTTLLVDKLKSQYSQVPPREMLEKQLLEQMVVEIIQKQLAAATGVFVDDVSLDMEIRQIAGRNQLDIQGLKQKIEGSGVPFDEYREDLRKDITLVRLQQRELAQQVNVSSEDVDSYLQSPEGQDQSGVEYQLGHILLGLPDAPSPETLAQAEQEANKLVHELNQGADFQQVALSRSTGQQALSGGVLSWRKMGEIPTLFIKDATSMQLNDIRGPLRSPSGFHIIKLMGKRQPSQESMTQSRVRQILIKTGAHLSSEEAKTKLLEIRRKIVSQESSFSEMAKKHSQEMNTNTQGGDLGWLTKQQVVPEFYDAVKRLSIGELSEPFQTNLGWHLVEVTERRSEHDSVELARHKALLVLRNRKYEEALTHWLRELRDSASVEIYLSQAKS